MKYHIYSANYWSTEPDKLIAKYPCLKAYNFRIEEYLKPMSTRIRDERGRFISQIDYRAVRIGYVDIEKIEHLVEFSKVVGSPLIISDGDYGPEIQIYDGYIE